MARFEELMLCYGIHRDYWAIVTRFINDLRVEIKHEVSLHSLKFLKEAYHKTLETCLCSYPMRYAPILPIHCCQLRPSTIPKSADRS